MRLDLARFFGCVALLMAQSVANAQAEPDQPSRSGVVERAGSALLLLDVVVTDEQGRPVRGLTKEDFEVTLNGRDWPVYSLDDLCAEEEPLTSGKPGEVADAEEDPVREPPPLPASAAPAPDPMRFILFVDFAQLQQDGRQVTLQQARRWIEEIKRPEEEATIVAHATLSGLRELVPFTSDPVELLAALERAARDPQLNDPFPSLMQLRVDECNRCIERDCGGTICTPPPNTGCYVCCPVCKLHAREEELQGKRSLSALKGYLESLEGIPGRKALLLFHQNTVQFPGRFYQVPDQRANDHLSLMDQVGAEATVAKTEVHSAYVGDPLDDSVPGLSGAAVNTGAVLADFTGGTYGRGAMVLSDVLARAGRGSRCVYRVGLRQGGLSTGRPVRAKIYVGGKALPHRYRVQFLDEIDRWWRKARAVLRDTERYTDVDVIAAVVPVAASKNGWDLEIEVALAVESLVRVPAGEQQRADWEVGALLTAEDGSGSWEMLGLSSLVFSGTADGWVLHANRLPDLKPGRYRLGAFVKDRVGSAFGAAEASISIPAAGGDRVVGPVLMRADQQRVTAPLPAIKKKKPAAEVRNSKLDRGPVPVGDRAILRGDPLELLSWICRGNDEVPNEGSVRFLSRDNEPLFRFEDSDTKKGSPCRRLVDRIETAALDAGTYTYHLRWGASGDDLPDEATIVFQVVE